MDGKLKDALRDAILTSAEKAKKATNAVDTLQYTQAALNAVNALLGFQNAIVQAQGPRIQDP